MGTTVTAVFMAVITLILGVTGTLALIIFNDLRNQVRDTGKHLDSVVSMQWQMIWRINGMEDHLHETDGYRPPRLIGNAEGAAG